jgi:hypothetical protein
MTKRTCLGCAIELSGDVVTLEHILPQWLASEIERPNVKLKHFLHDEEKEDTLLRSYKLNTFTTRQVCARCNNGWMSRLEDQAKPIILPLMRQERSILMLTDDERRTLSRWAAKTAFMIAVSQTIKFQLPWDIFQALGKVETSGPEACFVFANQQTNLPKGFLYTNPSDHFSMGVPIQVRSGFSIDYLHFVVVIPFDKEPRMARVAAGLHTPLWPLDLGVLAFYKPIPKALPTANAYLDFLTNLVEVGVLAKQETVRLEFVSDKH